MEDRNQRHQQTLVARLLTTITEAQGRFQQQLLIPSRKDEMMDQHQEEVEAKEVKVAGHLEVVEVVQPLQVATEKTTVEEEEEEEEKELISPKTSI